MATTPVTAATEPAYGAKVTQERNVDAQQAAAMVSVSQYPEFFAEGDEEAPTQNGNISTQIGNNQQPAVTIKNPYMLLPPTLNFPQLRQKTPVERQYDAGVLWDVLASDPQASELTRMIARSLMNVGQ